MLKKIFKWIGISVGCLFGVALIAAIIINIHISSHFSTVFETPSHTIEVPTSEDAIEEGARLAKLRGCNGGCHGDGSKGQVFFELPGGSQVASPNVVRAAQNYSIEEFESIIRHGIRPDGSSVIIAMPSEMMYNLSDEDLGKITAFLRAQDAGDAESPQTHINFIGRLMMYMYKRETDSLLAAEKIDHAAARPDPLSDEAIERGRYLATTVCSECHGPDLRGVPAFEMPDLLMVRAYPLEDFRTLMKEGQGLGGKELGLMSEVAVGRFSYFNDNEIDDLHTYLQTLGSE